MPQWSAGLLPAPLNSDPGMKLLEQSVNTSALAFPAVLTVDPKNNGAKGDGITDDSQAWAQAIRDANAIGGTVFPSAGTYLVRNVTAPATTKLFALPGTVTLKLKPLVHLDGSPIINVTGSNVTIDGLGFDGNKANQSADGFSDAYDTGPNATGRAYRCAVKFKDDGTLMSGLTVARCAFANTYGSGIASNNTSTVRALYNTFDFCNFEAVYVYSDFLGASFTTDHQIIGNRVRNGGSGDPTTNSSAFDLSSAENFVVALNVVRSVERAGVKMEYCRQGDVVGNVFRDNSVLTFGGIEMQSTTTDINVVGNKIYNWSLGIIINPQVGQFGRNIAIKANTIDTTTAAGNADGISVGNGSIEHLHISGNTLANIKRNCIGIQPNGTLRGLSIKENDCTTTGTTGGGGILLNVTGGNWRDVHVETNLIDCGNAALASAGIYITSGDASTVAMLKLANNMVDVGAGHNGIREAVACVTSGICEDNYLDSALFLQSAGFILGPNNTVLSGSTITPTASKVKKITSTPYTGQPNEHELLVNLTVPGPSTITLPQTPIGGDVYVVKDGKGDAATNNITIKDFGLGGIEGGFQTIATNFGSMALVWSGTDWNILARYAFPLAAITAPNAQTAAYVQADVQSIVTAVNAIRADLTALRLTL